MNLRTAVIIATKNRPQDITNLVSTLAQQTVRPDLIVVSACDRDDVGKDNFIGTNIELIFGTPGSAVQRNRALSVVRGKFDVIIFFDDDFVPSRFWIERIHGFLAIEPEVMCVTGHVLSDGVLSGRLRWAEGQLLVEKVDSSVLTKAIVNCTIVDREFPYGCNMAFRAKSIEQLTFDERLVLYGWLEDRDFAFRASSKGRMVWTDAVWGVHLGTTGGRSSGLRFGYSQVVNPWYLMRKGTMGRRDGFLNMFRGLVGNALGSVFSRSRIDRWKRLKGNMIGIGDIVLGRWAPERASEL
jgi:glycosyltransferase involved in cell wall biosynthesis